MKVTTPRTYHAIDLADGEVITCGELTHPPATEYHEAMLHLADALDNDNRRDTFIALEGAITDRKSNLPRHRQWTTQHDGRTIKLVIAA